MKKMDIRLSEEMLRALFEGKKVQYCQMGEPMVTLYPERYGVFMTHEKMAEIRRAVGFQIMRDPEKFFQELFGEDTVREEFSEKNTKPL